MSASAHDVILGWMVTAPANAKGTPTSEVYYDIGDQRTVMREKTLAFCSDTASRPSPLFVDLDDVTWGLVGTVCCRQGWALFQGLCELEGQEDGTDYLALGIDETLCAEVVLLKRELLCAFLCRLSARQALFSAVQPLLAPGNVCPFDESGSVVLTSEAAAAEHYLELLLGRGPRERCPRAAPYLQGVARDLTLRQVPYLVAALEDRAKLRPEDSALAALETLDGCPTLISGVPRDFQEDLALAVAAKALELVQALGLDL